MKVVLRNPVAPDGRKLWSLTVGREYTVLGIECGGYRLLDDTGGPFVFEPECIEVVDPAEPTFWVSRVGDEGERYADPPGWGVPGFHVAWHDGVMVVQRVFAQQLAVWYPDVPRRNLDLLSG